MNTQTNTKTNTKPAETTKKDEFVVLTTAKGHKYNIPKKYETQSKVGVSAVIRAMAADGHKAYAIHKITGIRAQHAYNVLSQPLVGTTTTTDDTKTAA